MPLFVLQLGFVGSAFFGGVVGCGLGVAFVVHLLLGDGCGEALDVGLEGVFALTGEEGFFACHNCLSFKVLLCLYDKVRITFWRVRIAAKLGYSLSKNEERLTMRNN